MSNSAEKQSAGDKDINVLKQMHEVTAKRATGDFNNSLPRVEAFIPKNILINCPLNKRGMIRAANCRACIHFDGIVQTAWDDETDIQWDMKYAIRCGAPLERKCISMIEEI